MVWIVLLACSAPSPDPVGALDWTRLEVSGCDGWAAVPPGAPRTTCLLPPGRPLVLWVQSATPPAAPAAQWVAVDDGYRATLSPPSGPLVVEAADDRWTLRIEPWPRAPALDEALTRKDHDMAGALAALAAAPADRPERRAELVVAGWILRGTAPDPAEAELLASEGQGWYAARLALLIARHEHESGGPDALKWVAKARGWLAGGPTSFDQTWLADYRAGLAAQSLGDHRRALRAFDDAKSHADRIGDAAKGMEADRLRIATLVRTGQGDELVALGVRIAAGPVDPDRCAQAQVLNSYAWGLILQADAGGATVGEPPGPLLERALVLLDGARCAPAHRPAAYTAQVHLNLALVALGQADPVAADRHLRAAFVANPTLVEPWALEIEARIALARGDPAGALAVWRRLMDAAGEQLELAWMARRGQGRALAAMGRTEDAIAALADAQALFFRQGLLAPAHLGRAAYLEQRDGATADLAELLLARGRTRDAFDAFRNQRAQYQVGLHQMTRIEGTGAPAGWDTAVARFRAERRAVQALPDPSSLPLDARAAAQRVRERHEAEALRWLDEGSAALGVQVELVRRRAGPGEVLVGWFPTDRGWLGFAERGDQVVVHRWDDQVDDGALVAPFAALLRGAELVTLLPHGRLADRDLHAAPLDGRPLAHQVVVRYGLDLVTPGQAAGERALLISDPRRDLRAARAEAEIVRERWGPRPIEILAGDAATGAAVAEALGRADRLHFTGHAAADAGWSSYLALAGDDRLDVAGVLALPRVPRQVVLNACETGAGKATSLGLAQAFVIAGAGAVVATGRPVDDALALAFAEALSAADPSDLGVGYREALRALADQAPSADWASYRLIVE